MNKFQAVVGNEVEKLYRQRKAVVFLILTALIPLAAAALFSVLQNRLGIFAVSPAGFPTLVLSLMAGLILPLFIFTLTADIFAGELADRTMKITLLRPVSRWKVYAGKNAAIALFSGLTLLVSFVFAMVGGLFLLGGAGLIRGVPQAALAYLVTWLPMLALGIIAAFFSQFFKQSSGALLANIFIYLLGKGLPFVSSAVGRLTPYFYTSWYVGWLGQTAGFGRLLQVLIILIAYSIMFLGAGFYFFDRREL